jgi:stage III sporulation protein AE
MKRWLLIAFVFILVFPSLGFAAKSAPDDTGAQDVFGASAPPDMKGAMNDALGSADLSGLGGEYGEYLKRITGEDAGEMVYDFTSGDFSSLSAGDMLSAVFGQLFSGIRDNIPVLVQVLVILLILSVLKQLSSNLMSGTQSVSGAAYYVGYIIVCGLIVSIVYNIFGMGREVINTVAAFTEYVTPVLFTLLTAIGGFASASVLQPAIAAFTGGVTQLVTYFIFPALIVNIVFVLVGNLSSNLNLKGFSTLIGSVIKWSMGIIFIVFLGIVAIQGAGAGLFDGISIRTAKYTLDKTVPVVGGMFSESVDTIVASSALVKNAVGLTGLLIIGSILLSPAVTLTVNIFMFKILSAITAPFSDKRTTEMLDGTASVIILLLVAVITVGVMAFILIAILLGVGNVNMMMR